MHGKSAKCGNPFVLQFLRRHPAVTHRVKANIALIPRAQAGAGHGTAVALHRSEIAAAMVSGDCDPGDRGLGAAHPMWLASGHWPPRPGTVNRRVAVAQSTSRPVPIRRDWSGLYKLSHR